MQCLQEEMLSGKDDCLSIVLKSWESKSEIYYSKLCDVFGSSEYFEKFCSSYKVSEFPQEDEFDENLLYGQLHSILELRAILAIEVEALQELRREIEDSPSVFEIHDRLTNCLKEQRQLDRENIILKEQIEKLQMEKNAFDAILDEQKRDMCAKLNEANERVRKAEKAFVDLTRRRAVLPEPSASKSNQKPSTEEPAQQESTTVSSALASIASPYRSVSDKVHRINSRFNEYNTLTAWEGFDSLDENSDDDDIATPTTTKQAKIEPSTPVHPPPPTVPLSPVTTDIEPPPQAPSTPVKKAGLPAEEVVSPIGGARGVGGSFLVNDLIPSKSSTPRKAPAPTDPPTSARQSDTSPPESTGSERQQLQMQVDDSNIANHDETVLRRAPPTSPPLPTPPPPPYLDGDTSAVVVDQEAYMRLYDEVIELRSELERLRRTPKVLLSSSSPLASGGLALDYNSQASITNAQANEHGLTTQLLDLHNQVCEDASPLNDAGMEVGENPLSLSDNRISVATSAPISACLGLAERSFASPATTLGALPIPLSENKHLTDWSVSLDQTANNSLRLESDFKRLGYASACGDSTPRPSMCMVVDVSGSGRRVLHFSPPSPQVLVDGQGNGDCSHCSGPVISAQATFCLPSMSSANISFQVVQQPRPHSTSRSDLDSSTANITTPSSCFGESKSSCSVEQQTELPPFECIHCYTEITENIPQHCKNNCESGPLTSQSCAGNLPVGCGMHLLSPASTLQEVNIDFSEANPRQGYGIELSDAACSPMAAPPTITRTHDVPIECNLLSADVLEESNRQLSDSVTEAVCVCLGLKQQLSALQTNNNSAKTLMEICPGDDCVNNLGPTLQDLSIEVQRVMASYRELMAKQANQPSHEFEIDELRDKLEAAERMLEQRLSTDTKTVKRQEHPLPRKAALQLSESLLETERRHLQEEMDRRLAVTVEANASSMAEMDNACADLKGRLSLSEQTSVQLREERDSALRRLAATDRFLNEQLQERELEQEEIHALKKQCDELRLKLTTLERQHQRHQHSSIASTSLPFVSSSPRLHLSVIPSQGAASAEATTPSVFFGSDLIDNPPCDQLRRDSASDVDDSPAFELVPTPRLPQSSVKTTPFKKNWSRPHSAGDSVLRTVTTTINRDATQLPAPRISVAVGGSPVERLDVSISAQSSLSILSSSCSSTEFDNIENDEEEEEVTTTTAATALGLITTTTTTTTKSKKTKSANTEVVPATTKRRYSRHLRGGVDSTRDGKQVAPFASVGLDAELRHVEEMTELRDTLASVQASLAEKDIELGALRQRCCCPSLPEPQIPGSNIASLHENVLVQTISFGDAALGDFGACWACGSGRGVVEETINPSRSPPPLSPLSRGSTLSPPASRRPLQDSLDEEQEDDDAEVVSSNQATASGATDLFEGVGEVEDEVAPLEPEEETPPEQSDFVHSSPCSESSHLAADLEEARAEIDALRAEIEGLINYQDDLLRDFEVVHSMLEERQSEVERLQQELLVVPAHLQADFDASIRKLQSTTGAAVTSKCEVVEERDEDLYVLNEEKEALASRVNDLEAELAILRQATVDVSEAASQTDLVSAAPTTDSGIQVDLDQFPPPTPASSPGDTDCEDSFNDEEADLPYSAINTDGGGLIAPHLTANTATGVAVPPPRTVEEVQEAVDRLQHESCRLLSLSLAKEISSHEENDPPDFKSQALHRLIEANRMLKDVVEEISKHVKSAGPDGEGKVAMTNSLYTALLSALLADRKTNLALFTSTTIDRATAAVAAPATLPASSLGACSINDVMKTLAGYANAEEERWKALSSAIESDRSAVTTETENAWKQRESLLQEVVHLTDTLAAREGALASVAAELKRLEEQADQLSKQLEETRVARDLDAKTSRMELEAEQKRVLELDEQLAQSQEAFARVSGQLASLEKDLQKSDADVRLERNRSLLAETRIGQLEQEVKSLKSVNVRARPRLDENSNVDLLFGKKKEETSSIARVSDQLAVVRRHAIQAEKMSRELHTCNQGLRVSLAEAELSLLPRLSVTPSTIDNGIFSGSSGGEESPPLCSFNLRLQQPHNFPPQLTDSGFADAPAEVRRLYVTCMRLVRLVAFGLGGGAFSSSGSSSSTDSLNNPAELLRHAILSTAAGGDTTTTKKTEYTSVDVYECLAAIETQVRGMVGGFGDANEATTAPRATAHNAGLLAQAKQMILAAVAHMDRMKGDIANSKAPLFFRPPTESKSTQVSLVTSHESSGSSRTVSIEKFRHMSARYLRMESYRRALVYQKQYLLLLLGDFQHTVQWVTASLGQGVLMGVSSRGQSDDDTHSTQQQRDEAWPLSTPAPLVRFRSAARCIMVIHRVKQLRLKWQRTGIRNYMSSPFPPHSLVDTIQSTSVSKPQLTGASSVSFTQSNDKTIVAISPEPAISYQCPHQHQHQPQTAHNNISGSSNPRRRRHSPEDSILSPCYSSRTRQADSPSLTRGGQIEATATFTHQLYAPSSISTPQPFSTNHQQPSLRFKRFS